MDRVADTRVTAARPVGTGRNARYPLRHKKARGLKPAKVAKTVRVGKIDDE
jgi:hypothetical protein